MHAALLLSLLLSSSAAQGGAETAARVEVLEGRAWLAATGLVERMQEGEGERRVEGPAHLQVPSGSRARVTWSAQASILLEGRSVLAWRPAADGVAPHWDLSEVGMAHLELRRGPLQVSLSGGWDARLHSGACALRGTPAGFELDHQAGLPIDLWPPNQGGAPSAPFTVLAGARVSLVHGSGRPLALAGSHGRMAGAHARLGVERSTAQVTHPPWRGFAWPWASPLPAPSIEAGGGAAPDEPDLPELVPGAVATVHAEVAPQPQAPASPRADPPPQLQEALEIPASPPSADARVRERGVLVLTPYGPRWLEASRPVDAALRPVPAAGRNR